VRSNPQGSVALYDTVIEEKVSGKPNWFMLDHVNRRPFLMAAADEDTTNKWIVAINSAQNQVKKESEGDQTKRKENNRFLNKKAPGTKKFKFVDTLGESQKTATFFTDLNPPVNYRTAFFILKDNILYQLTSEKSNNPELIIELEDYQIHPIPNLAPDKYGFVLFHPAATSIALVSLANLDQIEEWRKLLKTAITNTSAKAQEFLTSNPRATRMISSPKGIIEMRGIKRAICQGELSIQNPKKPDRWIKKYFVLHRNVLFSFKNELNQKIPTGVIPLDGCFVEVITTNLPYSIVIDHPKRSSVVLATNSEEEQKEWCKFIEEACTVTFDKKSPFQDMKERLSQKNSSKEPTSLTVSLDEVSISGELGIRSTNEIGIPAPKWFILKKNILFQCSQRTDLNAIDALELEDYALNSLPAKKWSISI